MEASKESAMKLKCMEKPDKSSELLKDTQKENACTGNTEQSESGKFATTEPSQENCWDEHSWALEQLDKSEDTQWFELDHVKNYYESLGGIYLAKFTEKYENVKMIEEEKLYTNSTSAITAEICERSSSVVDAQTEVLEKPESRNEDMTLKWVNSKLNSNSRIIP